jgi:hypothetical protein
MDTHENKKCDIAGKPDAGARDPKGKPGVVVSCERSNEVSHLI